MSLVTQNYSSLGSDPLVANPMLANTYGAQQTTTTYSSSSYSVNNGVGSYETNQTSSAIGGGYTQQPKKLESEFMTRLLEKSKKIGEAKREEELQKKVVGILSGNQSSYERTTLPPTTNYTLTSDTAYRSTVQPSVNYTSIPTVRKDEIISLSQSTPSTLKTINTDYLLNDDDTVKRALNKNYQDVPVTNYQFTSTQTNYDLGSNYQQSNQIASELTGSDEQLRNSTIVPHYQPFGKTVQDVNALNANFNIPDLSLNTNYNTQATYTSQATYTPQATYTLNLDEDVVKHASYVKEPVEPEIPTDEDDKISICSIF